MSVREQKLVDIIFQVAQHSAEFFGDKESYDLENHMAWVSRQLRECGFDTEQCGMSWGVLRQETSRKNN